jgi:hypothetical protein
VIAYWTLLYGVFLLGVTLLLGALHLHDLLQAKGRAKR